MHPVAKEYVAESMPPDPLEGDLVLHRVPGQSVYSVLPMTNPGRAFVLGHIDSGYAAGDMLMVPARKWYPFINALLDAMLDEGLRVV